MKLSRTELTFWVEIITGQNNLNYIQSKIYPISPDCRFCEEEEETIPHILNECPCFRIQRCEILQDNATELHEWTQTQILKFCSHPSIRNALSFDTLNTLIELNTYYIQTVSRQDQYPRGESLNGMQGPGQSGTVTGLCSP